MAEFASTGKANAALTTGIIGTSLGGLLALGSNLLGGNMNNCGCSENQFINRYELERENKLVAKDSEIALLKSNIYTDQKISDVYERLNNKIAGVEAAVNTQAVVNATMTGTISCMQGQIAQLQSLTKLVVPNSSVCPGWGEVKVTMPTAPAA